MAVSDSVMTFQFKEKGIAELEAKANALGVTLTRVTQNANGTFSASGKLSSALDEQSKSTDKVNSSNERASSSQKNYIAHIAKTTILSAGVNKAFLGIVGSMGDAVKQVDLMQNFPAAMAALGLSSKDASQSLNVLKNYAGQTGISLTEATQSVARFAEVTKNVKAATAEFVGVKNALIAGGAETTVQANALEQLTQAYSRGKPQLIEWKSLMVAMPAQLTAVAQAMKLPSAQALGEALTSGKVTMQDFMTTLTTLSTGTGPIATQALARMQGIQYASNVMKQALTNGLAAIYEAVGRENIISFFTFLTQVIGVLANWVVILINDFITLLNWISAVFGGGQIKNFTGEAKGASDALGAGAANAGDMANGLDDAANSADKINKSLASFDKMNVLPDKTSGKDKNAGVGQNGIDAATAGKLDNIFGDIGGKMKSISGWAKIFAGAIAAFAGYKVLQKLVGFGRGVSDVFSALGGARLFRRNAKTAAEGEGELAKAEDGLNTATAAEGGKGKIATWFDNFFSVVGSANVLRAAGSAALVGLSILEIAYAIKLISDTNINYGNLVTLLAAFGIVQAMNVIVGKFAGVETILGAVAGAISGGALYLIALALSNASKQTIDLPGLLLVEAALVIVTAIFALLGASNFVLVAAALGAIGGAIVSLGLDIAAHALSDASNAAKGISVTQLLELSGAIGVVSLMMAAVSISVLFGVIGSIGAAIIGLGLDLAAHGLAAASNEAKNISIPSLITLADAIHKIADVVGSNWASALKGAVAAIGDAIIGVGISKAASELSKASDNAKGINQSSLDSIVTAINKVANLLVEPGIKVLGGALASVADAFTAGRLESIATHLVAASKAATGLTADALKPLGGVISFLGTLDFGNFIKKWGQASSANSLDQSVNHAVDIVNQLKKLAVPADLVTKIQDIQGVIDAAGALKFSVTAPTAADLQQGVLAGAQIATNFINGIKSMFDMAANAGLALQGKFWAAIHGQTGSEYNQGAFDLAGQVINGVNSQAGAMGNAGHNLQTQFWNAIHAQVGAEYGQGFYDLAGQVLSGINAQIGSGAFYNAGHAAQNAFWTAINQRAGDERNQGYYDVAGALLAGINDRHNDIVNAGYSLGNAFMSSFKGGINQLLPLSIAMTETSGTKNTKTSISIPKLARGGIVDQATMAIVGENGSEAIMPLDNNTEWIDKLATKLNDRQGDGQPVQLVVQIGEDKVATKIINLINEKTSMSGRNVIYV